MRIKSFLWLLLLAASTLLVRAEPIQPLDLKPFVGPSPFDTIGATWLPPRGPQVIDGTPFQIDGVVLMYGNYPAQQRNKPGRTNINGIAVGRAFECLHLFATTQAKATDGTPLVKIHFQYADGSSNALEISYGIQVRNWFGPCHQTDEPLADPNVREVWRALFSAAATGDSYLRMYHIVLTNPSSSKEVRTLALESLKKPSGLMIAAMSVGPRTTEPLPDTVAALKGPFPDLRPREGERVRGAGVVRRVTGEPLAGARVRVIAVRKFTESYSQATETDEDVGAEAMTGEDGIFTLPPLRDDRAYHLLAVAEGFETAPFGGADVKSDPIEFRLKADGQDEPPRFFVRAQVVDPDDKPVSWATVEPEGIGTEGRTSWGGSSGFPEQIVTRKNGEFMLGRKELFTRLQVRIKARGFAPEMTWLPVTNGLQTIKLGPGATIRGRVVKDSAPLAGVRVGVSGSDRSSEVFAGHFETKTDTNGVFAFEHLPPNTSWYFYGIMSSLKAHGSLLPQPVTSAAHGEATDLGELEVKPGLRLAGQVKTRGGEPLPKGLKVRASHDNAWDSQSVPIDDEGRFALEGLWKGQLEIGIDQRDWRLTGANRSMDLWNSWRLSGRLETDKDDLVLEIEKGQPQYNSGVSGNGQLPSQDQPQNRTLFGAEKSGPASILLAGQVLDDKSGSPVREFKLTPGYKPPVTSMPAPPKPVLKQLLQPFTKANNPVPWNERPFWQFARAQTISNGNFSVEFQQLSSTPILRFEADGYEPLDVESPSSYTNNLVVRLKPGAGPSGVVVLPNGKPVIGATVIYGANQEQFSLSGKDLSSYGRSDAKQTTDKNGDFSFPVRAQGSMLFVAHDVGWAEASVERGGAGLTLELRPWASVTGTLVSSNSPAPMAGVQLRLTIPNDWQRGEPHVNVQAQTTTDAQGRFYFPTVPPRRMELQRMIPFIPPGGRAGGGWTYHLQTWFVAQPGITNDLGKVIFDKPPPPPLLEQLKRTIGL